MVFSSSLMDGGRKSRTRFRPTTTTTTTTAKRVTARGPRTTSRRGFGLSRRPGKRDARAYGQTRADDANRSQMDVVRRSTCVVEIELLITRVATIIITMKPIYT